MLQAAQKTTIDDPFVRVQSAADQGFVNQAVLNVLSEKFSQTYLSQALGLPVRRATFVFSVVWERYGDMRSQKLRVLIVAPDALDTIANTDDIAVTDEPHRHRLTTLRKMHRLRLSDDAGDRSLVGEVELGVPAPS